MELLTKNIGGQDVIISKQYWKSLQGYLLWAKKTEEGFLIVSILNREWMLHGITFNELCDISEAELSELGLVVNSERLKSNIWTIEPENSRITYTKLLEYEKV